MTYYTEIKIKERGFVLGMGKRQIAAMQTRLKVIVAAKRLIEKNGFKNVTIDDITKEAKVAKGTFYTYFKRKEDVVSEIAKSNYNEIYKRSVELNGDIGDRITSFLIGSMEYIEQTGLKICQQWIKTVVEPEDQGGKEKLLYDYNIISDLLNQAIDAGELSKETPVKQLSDAIVSQYYGIVLTWGILNGASAPVELLKKYCQGQLRDSLSHYQI